MTFSRYAIQTLGMLSILPLCGLANTDKFRAFEDFRAPEVVGAYSFPMTPLGPTENGVIYSIGFSLKDGTDMSPTMLWVGRTYPHPLEVNSIAAINVVVDQVARGWSTSEAIRIECALIGKMTGGTNRPDFALDRANNPEVDKRITQLKESGLDQTAVALLKRLVDDSKTVIDTKANSWMRSWHEVDALGAIERVVVRGSCEPMRTNSILKETVFGAGTINANVLLRRILEK